MVESVPDIRLKIQTKTRCGGGINWWVNMDVVGMTHWKEAALISALLFFFYIYLVYSLNELDVNALN